MSASLSSSQPSLSSSVSLSKEEEKKVLAQEIHASLFDQSASSDQQALELVYKEYGVEPEDLAVSKKGNLRLISLKKKENENAMFRAMVLDQYGNMVAQFPEFPIEHTTTRIEAGKDGILVTDGISFKLELPADKTSLFRGISGTQLVIFRHGGETHIMTSTNADPHNSRYGNRSPKFLDILKESGFPVDSLFGNERYSAYFHTLILFHDTLLMVDQIKINKSSVVYLGASKNQLFDKERAKGLKDVSTSVSIPENMLPEVPKDFDLYDKPAIIQQNPITPAQAQEHLNSGWTSFRSSSSASTTATASAATADKELDPRLSMGEFVIAKVEKDDGSASYLKLVSPAFAFRESLAALDPSRPFNLNRNLTAYDPAYLPPYLLEEKQLEKGIIAWDLSKKYSKEEMKAQAPKAIRHSFLWAVNPADKDSVRALITQKEIDPLEVKAWLAKMFASQYLRLHDMNSAAHNKNVYTFLSKSFNGLKAEYRASGQKLPSGPPAQERAMFSYLKGVTIEKDKLYSINKARDFVEKKLLELKTGKKEEKKEKSK